LHITKEVIKTEKEGRKLLKNPDKNLVELEENDR
jgi:hypothetical protein